MRVLGAAWHRAGPSTVKPEFDKGIGLCVQSGDRRIREDWEVVEVLGRHFESYPFSNKYTKVYRTPSKIFYTSIRVKRNEAAYYLPAERRADE